MQMSVRGRFVGTCGEEGLRRFTIIFTDAHDKFLLSVDCLVKPSHSGTDAMTTREEWLAEEPTFFEWVD